MKMKLLIGLFAIFAITLQAEKKPLKVYILVGQSNMQGHATQGTLPHMAEDPKTKALHDKIVDENGKPRVYNDVYMAAFSGRSPENVLKKNGPLTIGYGKALGDKNTSFGPELGFGITMAEKLKEPILIIKTSWGGKSINTDFRSPSAGPYTMCEETKAAWKKYPNGAHGIPAEKDRPEWWKKKKEATGVYYRLMLKCVKEVLEDPSKVCKAYDPAAGYEIAGFVWFQGWNDMCDSTTYGRGKEDRYSPYPTNLAHFIRDLRKELNAPNVPFIIGVMGVGGESSKQNAFREAMAATAEIEDLKGSVVAVPTAPYWDKELGDFDKLAYDKKRQVGQEWKKKVAAMSEEERKALHKFAGNKFSHKRIPELLIEELGEEKYNALTKAKGNAGYHYLGSAKILGPIGEAFGKAMIKTDQ